MTHTLDVAAPPIPTDAQATVHAPRWTLSPDEYRATQDKIDRINERAVKRGFTGRLTVTGTPRTRTYRNPVGFEITEHVYDVTIGGTAPSYGGCTFLATADFDPEAGVILRTAPGAEGIDRGSLRPGYCEHCKLRRDRKDTYVIRTADGQQVQVGSTCIKDYLGWSGAPVFLSTDDVSREISDTLTGGHFDRRYDTLDVLAVAWATVKAYGFVPAGSYGAGPTTKDTVLDVLDPVTKRARQLAADLAPYIAESAERAHALRTWITEELTGGSEYVTNLRQVARADTVSVRNVGLLASAPQTWARAQERDLKRAQAADELMSGVVGQPKDKIISVPVVIKAIRWIAGTYGTTTLYTLVTTGEGKATGGPFAAGHVLKWFASRDAFGDKEGAELTIKATVKGRDDYNGFTSTTITRAGTV